MTVIADGVGSITAFQVEGNWFESGAEEPSLYLFLLRKILARLDEFLRHFQHCVRLR